MVLDGMPAAPQTWRVTSSQPPPSTLERTIGPAQAVWLGLGSILGTGVFVSLSIAAGAVESGLELLVAVGLAALVATANGLSSAQLAAAHPVSGGTYAYGRRYLHPAAGFGAGWLYLLAKSASAATAALGCAGYLLHLTGLGSGSSTALGVGLAVALVAAVTWLAAAGLRRSARVNTAIVLLTLLSLGALVAVGWVSDVADLARFRASAMEAGSAPMMSWSDPSALLEATALMFVAYTGYGRIATLGEEVRDPRRTIPRAIVLTLVVAATVYLSVAVTAVAVVGPAAFGELAAASAIGGGAPLEHVASALGEPWLRIVVAVGAVTAMAGVLLNLVLGLSRVLFAMARDGELPPAIAAGRSGAHSPTRAVLMVGAVVGGLALIGDVRTTWSFSALTVLCYYGLTNLAALRLPSIDRRYPRWIAASGLLACLGLATFINTEAWAIGAALLAGGFVVRALTAHSR